MGTNAFRKRAQGTKHAKHVGSSSAVAKRQMADSQNMADIQPSLLDTNTTGWGCPQGCWLWAPWTGCSMKKGDHYHDSGPLCKKCKQCQGKWWIPRCEDRCLAE